MDDIEFTEDRRRDEEVECSIHDINKQIREDQQTTLAQLVKKFRVAAHTSSSRLKNEKFRKKLNFLRSAGWMIVFNVLYIAFQIHKKVMEWDVEVFDPRTTIEDDDTEVFGSFDTSKGKRILHSTLNLLEMEHMPESIDDDGTIRGLSASGNLKGQETDQLTTFELENLTVTTSGLMCDFTFKVITMVGIHRGSRAKMTDIIEGSIDQNTIRFDAVKKG